MKRKQQGGLLPMVKFREILRLHEMGYSQCQIAQSCAVARSTVQDYVRRATAKNLSYAQLSQLSDSEAHQLLGKGKQKTQQKEDPIDFTAIEIELQRKGVTLALLWQEGLDKGQWHYSYATFCRRYNQWRLRQVTDEEVRIVLQSHGEGTSLRGISRISGLSYNTGVSLIRAASQTAQLIHNAQVQAVDTDAIAADA